MPRMEIKLNPVIDWHEEALDDWRCALNAFLTEKGQKLKSGPRLPGYEIIEIAGNNKAEIILSASERLVLLEGLEVGEYFERELAQFVLRFAREMGAKSLFVPVITLSEENFWSGLGGLLHPDPVPLTGEIERAKVSVEKLARLSILINYDQRPALCLEPIACNVHAPGVISLAQRRLEKEFGGQPLGFASRIAIHCPWDFRRRQWDDLLAYSRLQAFEVLESLVKEIKG